MRTHLVKILGTAAAVLLVAPQLAWSADREEQLRMLEELQARMDQVEDQIQATNEELDDSEEKLAQQGRVLEKVEQERRAASGLSAFLSETQFSGFVAASYNYNFNHPDASTVWSNGGSTIFGENLGDFALTAPHHSNANTFQVDQFFISMVKPATPESRGGWGAELVWGVGADANNLAVINGEGGATGDLSHLYQAYVEYLADVGENGINFKMGRFETLIGYESFRADRNDQITRGLLWSMQPVNHTGLLVSGECGCGIDWALGLVNSYDNTMSDYDNEKTFIGRVGWTGETASFHINGLYGGDVRNVGGPLGIFSGWNADEDEVGLFDVVATWDPSENLGFWANFDYYWSDSAGGVGASSMTPWGFAVGSHLNINETTGFSLRNEVVWFNDGNIFPLIAPRGIAYGGALGGDSRLHSLTGTLDHALSDNLTLKVEGRWDHAVVQNYANAVFIDNDDSGGDVTTDENQVLALIQLLYQF